MNIDRKTLTQALSTLVKIIEPRATLPLLACIKLDPTDGLELTATDLELSAILHINPLAQDPADELVAVDGKRLLKAVKALPKTMTTIALELRAGCVNVNGTKLTADPTVATDFPVVAVAASATKVPGLIAAISKAAPAVSHDEARYSINGVLLDFVNGKVVGTDGHRLHLSTIPVTGNLLSVIVPRKAIAVLTMPSVKATDEIAYVNGGICVPVANGLVTCRTIDGQFPNYQAILPKEHVITLTVQRTPFIEQLKQAKATMDDPGYPIRLMLKSDRVSIEADSHETMTVIEVAGASYTGKDLEVGCNARYMIEALEQITGHTIAAGAGAGSETIQITFKNAVAPLTIAGVDGFKAVIMPMRLGDRKFTPAAPAKTTPEAEEVAA